MKTKVLGRSPVWSHGVIGEVGDLSSFLGIEQMSGLSYFLNEGDHGEVCNGEDYTKDYTVTN